jgi:hypothetical protein
MMTTAADFARLYLESGWCPIPIPHGEKAPAVDGWQDLRLGLGDVDKAFPDPSNVGVILGDPSNGLVDVDLDSGEAVTLAPKFLPPTLRFGRPGKPLSHWLYKSPEIQSKAFACADPKDPSTMLTIVELRGNRRQTVFPPSKHRGTGEAIAFDETGPGDPAVVDAKALKDAVSRLALAALWVRAGVPEDIALDASPSDLSPLEVVPELTAKGVKGWFRAPVKEKSRPRTPSRMQKAVDKWNADHPMQYPRAGGDCPICGHRGCFGELPDAPGRWACFSASHVDGGIQGDSCWHGDALDIASRSSGITRKDFLASHGYYDARPAVTHVKSAPHESVDAAMPFLADCGTVFQRGQKLCVVVEAEKAAAEGVEDVNSPIASVAIERDPTQPIILSVAKSYLMEILSREIKWMKWDSRSEDDVPCGPPSEVVAMLHERGHWRGVPEILGITTVPILRPDGSMQADAGFDRASGLYYVPQLALDIPSLIAESPTIEDARAALDTLAEVVCDFPFTDPSGKAAWLSTVLTKVGRSAYPGGAPFFVVDAPQAGTGKSLLVDASVKISTGVGAARSPYVLENDEMRKQITSHLYSGDQVVLIDNVPTGGTIKWASFDGLLTGNRWQDRKLGATEELTMPNNTIWFATGNNIDVSGDLPRRTLRIRLNAECEMPTEKTGFRHNPLLSWVTRERGRLLTAAFTVLRAYILAGRPDQRLTPFASFEGWSDLVRSAIVWCGFGDPYEVCAEKELDMKIEKVSEDNVVRGWESLGPTACTDGLTCCQALDVLRQDPMKHNVLREAILELNADRNPTGDLPSAKILSWILKKVRDRSIGDGNGGLIVLKPIIRKQESTRWVCIKSEKRDTCVPF